MGIGSLYATATSLGAGGTVKTQLNAGVDITLPANCRSILAIRPELTVTTPTLAESVVAKASIESTELTIQPFEVLAEPINAGLSTIIDPMSEVNLPYVCNIPTRGGEKIKAYGQLLLASTVAPHMGLQILYSTGGVAGAQRRGLVSAITATGTALAAEVALPSLTFNGNNKLVEFEGIIYGAAITASKPHSGFIRVASNDFNEGLEWKVPLKPIHGKLGATGTCYAHLVRVPMDIGIKKTATINAYGTLEATAPSAAGGFVYGLMVV